MIKLTKHLNRGCLAAALVGLAALVSAMPASASDSVSVTVNATVIGVCKFFNTSTPVLNINNTGTGSNIDPSQTGDATGNATVAYRCSNGTTPAFSIPSPSVSVTCALCTGTPSMTATIGLTSGGAGTGMGSGNNKNLTVSGTITEATYVNAAAGSYTGTVTVSVTP
jgi:hypothetical protein